MPDVSPLPGSMVGMRSTVFLIDDDPRTQDARAAAVRELDADIELINSIAELLEHEEPAGPACLVVQARLGCGDPLSQLAQLEARGLRLPFLIVSDRNDVALAVEAMRRGAIDFLVEPCDGRRLLDGVRHGLAQDATACSQRARRAALRLRVDRLTLREREVMRLVAGGALTKQIATRLGISSKTVEVHRSHIMKKLEVHSMAQLVVMLHDHALDGAATPEGPGNDQAQNGQCSALDYLRR